MCTAVVSKLWMFFLRLDIPKTSPQFVGAWWLGLLIFGAVFLVTGIPVLMFPQQLPGTSKFRKNREKEMHRNGIIMKEKNKQRNLRLA